MTTKKPEAAASTAVAAYGEEFQGRGFENTTAADFSVPFLSVLQDGSPQVKENKEEYIEGAKPGMFFNTVTLELMSAPVFFIPCYTEHMYVEWKPRDSGGGFVDTHGLDSPAAKWAKANCKFGKFKTEPGNDLVETFYVYGMILPSVDALEGKEMLVLAFTSTKISRYKKAMSLMRTVKGAPPLFAFRLKLETSFHESDKGDYWNIEVGPAVGEKYQDCLIAPEGDGMALLGSGDELRGQVVSGVARAAHETQGGSGQAPKDDTPF